MKYSRKLKKGDQAESTLQMDGSAIGEVEVVATQDSCDVYLHTKRGEDEEDVDLPPGTRSV